MTNAIEGAIYNIFRETKQNFSGQQLPQQPCPRCGAIMRLNIVGDGRMGMFNCQRCKYRQMVRLG